MPPSTTVDGPWFRSGRRFIWFSVKHMDANSKESEPQHVFWKQFWGRSTGRLVAMLIYPANTRMSYPSRELT
jgi:hypothetical protein